MLRLFVNILIPPLIEENRANGKISTVVRFFSAKGVIASHIHRQIIAEYGENITSDGIGDSF